MNRNSDMVRILKRVSLITGFAILAISIQFSYDGFDQNVNGTNNGYTVLAIIIGYILAVVFSVIEFIFGTSYKDLNWTLRGIGVFAYVYSIYTNYLGIKHILGTSDFIAWSMAFVMDVYPEPAIAWALGEALTGDLFGNVGKMIFGSSEKEISRQQTPVNVTQHAKSQYKPKYKPTFQTPQSTVFSHTAKQPTKLASPIFDDNHTKRYKQEEAFKPQNYGD